MTVPMLPYSLETMPKREARRRRRRRRFLLLLLVALSALPSVTTSVISISQFHERAITGTDAWAPAAIDVHVDPALLMQVPGMLPGDRYGGDLTVANAGADALRYALISSSTDSDGRGLRDVLEAEIRSAGSGCEAFDGEVLYRGSLIGAGFGDPAGGHHAGDRLLGPGERELLCVEVTLPEAAGNHYQRSRTTATFTVVAEHAVVGP
jgi:hypothetical protein